MRERSVVSPRADWVGLVEALHEPAKDDVMWAENVVAAAHGVFAPGQTLGCYCLTYSSDLSKLEAPFVVEAGGRARVERLIAYAHEHGPRAWAPFHFRAAPVSTYREIAVDVSSERLDLTEIEDELDVGDGIGIVAHPSPGTVFVLHSMYEGRVALTRRDRELFARIGFHLDAAYRLRQRPDDVVAELSSTGKLLDRRSDAPDRAQLEAYAAPIGAARARKNESSVDLGLWTALVDGKVSIVPRGTGAGERLVVLANPPSRHGLHALTESEESVLALAARGATGKQIAYALGISSATASKRLARIATKLGSFSHGELIRVAALIAGDPRAASAEPTLTDAEHEVLTLLRRGLSNKAIADVRSRSVRTIANQVAGILRKVSASSRRELIAGR